MNILKSLFTSLLLICSFQLAFSVDTPIRVACVGNSITYGAGISNRDRDSYPSILEQMLGEEYEVRNFGHSARTLLNKGDHPYMQENTYTKALDYQPNIVILKLGTNDSKPQNWKYKSEFTRDLERMINDFRKLPSKPTIYLCYPAKVYKVQWGINDSVIVKGVIPYIDRVARKMGTKIIDLHSATDQMEENFPDKVHPNKQGAIVIAQTVYKAITGKEKRYEPQAFPGKKGEWNGYDRYDFRVQGRDATVVVPQTPAEGTPWIWRPAFFNAFPTVDKALLEKGFHVVYYDLTHLYGSPNARKLGTSFYEYMTKNYGLSPYVTLEGFSRGGLFVFNWAAENPEKVACIYADAPVCDLASWPGRESPLWHDVTKEWGETIRERDILKDAPIHKAREIAKTGIPIISVCGDSDDVVSYNVNMGALRNKLAELGASVEIILKPGVGHHPHSLDDPKPVVDFILRNQPAYQKGQYITQRGSLSNSYIKFERNLKGRVAFLGGSITEMEGWTNLIEKQLKQRFPNTEFDFINAGIPSTGSTPGAFRFTNDVLANGPVDLLFVEAAVNDDTNGFSPTAQVRGMEGEVRRALMANKEVDIVMLHFIYDPFIELYGKGVTPEVIDNHERVAEHYQIPSINFAREISERMQKGEFTWDEFGGVHPAPFGHEYYAAGIARLFDAMWSGIRLAADRVVPHTVPNQPLDAYSYFGGRFLDIKTAQLSAGWKYVPSWRAEDGFEKRPGFVDVPMLEATKAGAKLTLDFEGTAIGIFCVSGPSAGTIEYSIDGAPYKSLDTYTQWSSWLYIPWLFMLEDELKPGKHKLKMRMAKSNNVHSKGYELQIRNFVVNQ